MLLSRLLKQSSVKAKSGIDFGGNWYSAPQWISGGVGMKTASGKCVSSASAMAIPAYFACIRAISEDTAKLPLPVYRRLSAGRESVYDHPAAKAIRNPNQLVSSMSLREAWVQHALGFGNGYIEIARDAEGNPAELYLIDPTTVTLKRESGAYFYEVKIREGNMTVRLAAENVLHLHGLGYDSVTGYNVANIFREILGATIAAREFGGSFWANGAFLGGVLTHPAALSDKALEHLRESFQERHGGSGNVGKWYIAEEGMTFQQFGIEPSESKLIETYQFNTEDIARIFRMPLHKIGHLLHATFSNIEHQGLEYVGDTIMPWAVRIEQEMTRKLFREDEEDLYIKHNMAALMRGDAAARSDYYMKMIQLGMTQNQILELEEMNPIGPEGDISYVALNIRPATQEAREAAMAAPAPTSPTPDKASDPVVPDKGGRPKNQIAAEYGPVFEALLDPLFRKECNAVSKAAKRHDDRGDFLNTIARFHVEHKEQMRNALEPAIASLVAILGGERADERVDLTCRTYCDAHLDGSIEALKAVEYPWGIEALMETWMLERTKTTAGRLARAAVAIAEGQI